MIAELARHGIVLSLLCAGLGLGWILKTYGHTHHESLSLHAAKQRPSYYVFLMSLCVSALFFYWFCMAWLVPHFQLGPSFAAIVTVAVILAAVAAVVPDGGGSKTVIHRLAAWSMAMLLPVLLVSVMVSGMINPGAQLAIAALLAYMFAELFLFVFVKSSRRHFLFFQSTYILSFYLALVIAAYAS